MGKDPTPRADDVDGKTDLPPGWWKSDSGTPGREAHLLGAAGSGMRSLARVLRQRGWILTGSDADPSAVAELRQADDNLFARLFVGHDAGNVPERCELVLASDAVGPDNPERMAAERRGLTVVSYAEALAGLMRAAKQGLAVAGTHGKSTTTAMAAHVLVEAGHDPTVVCGEAALGRTDGGRAGQGDALLVEACEFRRNFLKLRPRHAVVLGVEPDHFDCYPTEADLEAAFAQFVRLLPSDGLLLARADCPVTRRILSLDAARRPGRDPATGRSFGVCSAGSRPGLRDDPAALTPGPSPNGRGELMVETFALDGSADWMVGRVEVDGGRYRFDVVRRGEPLCRVGLAMPGRHNMLNALAAAALTWHQGVEPERIAEALGRFRGLRRRLETVGRVADAVWVDDYAHHPTEVRAALAAVREMAPGRRVCCVFQPHQASRTRRLLDELADSLHNVDKLWIAEIYRAREGAPRPGEATAAELADRVRRSGGCVSAAHGWSEIAAEVCQDLSAGDVFITMGAGDIRRMADELLDGIRTVHAAS